MLSLGSLIIVVGRGRNAAYETTPAVFALLSLAASPIVMVARQILVRTAG